MLVVDFFVSSYLISFLTFINIDSYRLTSVSDFFVQIDVAIVRACNSSRDAPIIGRLSDVLPIIGIGRLICRYQPIVIYYVLWWHWILKLYLF